MNEPRVVTSGRSARVSLIRRHRRKRARREYMGSESGRNHACSRKNGGREKGCSNLGSSQAREVAAHACALSGVEQVNVVDVEACKP